MCLIPGWTSVRAVAVASAIACGQSAVPADRQLAESARVDTLESHDQRLRTPLESVPPPVRSAQQPTSRFLGAQVTVERIEVDPADEGPYAAAIGRFVRSREPQLRFCYQEYGLKHAPTLGGDVQMVAVVSRVGAVDTVAVAPGSYWLQDEERSSRQVESCLVQRVRGWRFPHAREPRLLRFSVEMRPPPDEGDPR